MFVKKFNEWINESYAKRNSFDEYANVLKKYHPRSSKTDGIILKAKSLLDGTVDKIARSDFHVGRGEQWGHEWIDSLVDHGVLSKIKIGRKVFIVPIDNKQSQEISRKSIVDSIVKEAQLKERRHGNIDNITWKYNESNGCFEFSHSNMIGTWIHWEKGHGDSVDKSDIEEHKKELESEVINFYITEFIEAEIKKSFKIKSKGLYEKNTGPIESFGRDNHKGFLYSVKYKIEF